jgi:glyoxylase-like metal-dependent hydrolase (beta-lactamase superfamily II)
VSLVVRSLEGNRQRLDGGSMFGNVPRLLWSRWIAPDERHRIPLACRCFLVTDEETGRRVLLETGIGAFFGPDMADRYGVEEREHVLLGSLAEAGVSPEEIDAVVLSHLHFDHAGGLLTPFARGSKSALVFPRARFVVGRAAWERARSPHARDRASFVPMLNDLLEKSGRLELVEGGRCETLGDRFELHTSDGHTPGLLLAEVKGSGRSALFCGDLIPGTSWVHLPVTMGYDRFPELIIDEKRAFLERALERSSLLLLTHDPVAAACSVARDATGRFTPVDPVERLDRLVL